MANNRLTRDTEHAMLGGVCAGIANRLGLDPTIVRVATIVLGLITLGTTVLVYLALWIIMPAGEATPHRPSRDELTEEVRDAAERVQEAARIMTGAAKQAMDEMSHIQGRRRDVDTPASSTPPATEDSPSHDATTHDATSNAGVSGPTVSPPAPGPADGSEVTPSEPSVSPEIPPAASQPSGSVGGAQNWTPPSPADPAPNAPLGDEERREDGQPQG